MRANQTLLALLLLLITFTRAHRALAEDVESATETNEIIPREAIEKLDFSVRQALLRAIDKLEQEEAEKEKEKLKQKNSETIETTAVNQKNAILATATATTTTTTTTTSDSLAKVTKDEVPEESAAPDEVVPTVQFFTATFDEKNTQEQPLSSFIDRSKTWKKALKTLKQSTLGAPVVVSESEGIASTAQSYQNHQTARSVGGSSVRSNEISNEQNDEIKFEIRSSKNGIISATTTTTTPATTTTPKPRTTKRIPRPTTTTTTTTTTPRPTHNEDGENIEVVDKQDIKIQEAPLVTAFTVDLDERGSTKNVIPIIHPDVSPVQPVVGPTITKLNVLPAGQQTALFISTALPTLSPQLTTPTSNPLTTGIAVTEGTGLRNAQAIDANTNPPIVNNYLIERQRQLEQQIYQLKLQAQQQQELILRQLKFLEQQSQIQNKSPNILSAPQQQQQQQLPVPTVATLLPQQQQNFGLTIRPSVEFIPSTHTESVSIFSPFPVQQQLPLNDAPNKFINTNFNTNINNNNNNETPSSLRTQQLPLNNPVRQIFHNLQNLQNSPVTAAPTNLAPTTVQVQPSNQFSFSPTFIPAVQTKQPLELSVFQPLPQHNFQQFQQQQQQQQQQSLVPSYVTNAILQQQQHQQQQRQQQQQQHQQHQHQHNRFFRQESGTGNFGLNQVEIQPSNSFTTNLPSSTINQQTINNQNFYRQHLDPQFSSQLQQNAQQFYEQQQRQQKSTPALNHGINAFGAQNLHFNGGGF